MKTQDMCSQKSLQIPPFDSGENRKYSDRKAGHHQQQLYYSSIKIRSCKTSLKSGDISNNRIDQIFTTALSTLYQFSMS